MDISRSFKFAFKASGASKKIVLGGIFSFLLFTVFFPIVVVGYMMRVLCEALEGRDAKLPDWSLRQLFNEGLMPTLILLAYNMPHLVLMILGKVVFEVSGMNLGLMTILMVIHLIYAVITMFLIPPALIRFAVKRSMRAAFNLGQILGYIGKNKGPFFTAFGLSLAAGVVASIWAIIWMIVAMILFFATDIPYIAYMVGGVFVGLVFSILLFVTNLISMHLWATAYRASTPFEDDTDGELRASMAIPPPIRH